MAPGIRNGGRPERASDPRHRFSGAAAGYARFRPGYPDALVDRVVTEAGVKSGDPVADVGCGTGIFTRMLAARGLEVTGIDPDPAVMRAALEDVFGE